jgi:hypothetical protein
LRQAFEVERHYDNITGKCSIGQAKNAAREQCLCGFGRLSLVTLAAPRLAQVDTAQNRA